MKICKRNTDSYIMHEVMPGDPENTVAIAVRYMYLRSVMCPTSFENCKISQSRGDTDIKCCAIVIVEIEKRYIYLLYIDFDQRIHL